MYHGFVLHDGTPPEESDSELQLGGTQLVDASVFDAFDYVALGHIHKPQWVRSGKMRYSGSLMKYSFSETLQKKSLTLLDWKEKDNLTVTAIPLCPETDMRIIRGKLEDLLTYAQPSADWIRAELTDETLVPYAMERLRAVYPNVLELEFFRSRSASLPASQRQRQCRRSPCWNWWIVFAAVSISMSFQSMRQRRR